MGAQPGVWAVAWLVTPQSDHEDGSGPAEDVAPGPSEAGAAERPCESLPALTPSSFPTVPFRRGWAGVGMVGAANSLPQGPFSVGLLVLAAFRNKLGDADGSPCGLFNYLPHF